jgi:hypothetical protein
VTVGNISWTIASREVAAALWLLQHGAVSENLLRCASCDAMAFASTFGDDLHFLTCDHSILASLVNEKNTTI